METASLLFLRKKFNEFDVHDELVSDVITAFEKASDMFINVVIKQRKNVHYEKIGQDREADISEAIKQAIIMFEDRGHGNADKDGRYAFALEQLSRFFSASNMELESVSVDYTVLLVFSFQLKFRSDFTIRSPLNCTVYWTKPCTLLFLARRPVQLRSCDQLSKTFLQNIIKAMEVSFVS